MEKFVQTIHNQIFAMKFPESNSNMTKKIIETSSTLFKVKKLVSNKQDADAAEFETLMSALLYPNDFSQTLNKYDR